MTGDRAELQGLLDRAAVTELVYRYAQAVDDRDLRGILDCFTDDAEVAFDGGDRMVYGREGLRAFFERAFDAPLLGTGVSTHVMSNVLVALADGNAHVETQGVAYLATDGSSGVVARGLRYSDRCILRREGWKIRRRVHSAIWEAELPRRAVSPALPTSADMP